MKKQIITIVIEVLRLVIKGLLLPWLNGKLTGTNKTLIANTLDNAVKDIDEVWSFELDDEDTNHE